MVQDDYPGVGYVENVDGDIPATNGVCDQVCHPQVPNRSILHPESNLTLSKLQVTCACSSTALVSALDTGAV